MSRAITVIPPRTGTSPAPRASRFAPPEALAVRRVLHVTTSARGEAPEVVRSAVERAREAGVDVDWATVSSEGWFVPVVERLTSALQGFRRGGAELREPEQLTYTSVLRTGAGMLAEMFVGRELVLLHDPATAGLCRPLKRTGAVVAWVCHVAVDEPNDAAREAWEFLSPHLDAADCLAFLRPVRIPADLIHQRMIAPPPSLDSLPAEDRAPKEGELAAILGHLSAATSPS